ncbi:Uncharacterised protein [BD1-7 clade bacterium]|nr:Uncharacterised protein [BD1-7 clade bacterium]
MKKLLLSTTISTIALLSANTYADQVIQDDQIVNGSLCVGLDCNNGEAFGFDTIRLKENNVRIRAIDSSSSSSFPSVDWQLTFNDSANGGANKFSIEDITATKVPFTITAGAPNHSIFVHNNGYVGLNTSTPLVQLHVKHGNSPALRLEQDSSSGFTSQAWDVAGNETNFFIRDVSNGSKIPFKIKPGAPNDSLFINANGDIGMETSTPDGMLDIAHPSNANNHAVLLSSTANFGINIDNSYLPLGLLDVQTTNGTSRFMVSTDGKVGINMGSSNLPTGPLEVRHTPGEIPSLLVDSNGKVGINTSAPADEFEVRSADGTQTALTVTSDAKVGVGTSTPSSTLHIKNTDPDASNITLPVLVENTITTPSSTASENIRTLMALKNNGGAALSIEHASKGTWYVVNNNGNLRFFYNTIESSGLMMMLKNDGELRLRKTVVENAF